jgi:hypothetical protein
MSQLRKSLYLSFSAESLLAVTPTLNDSISRLLESTQYIALNRPWRLHPSIYPSFLPSLGCLICHAKGWRGGFSANFVSKLANFCRSILQPFRTRQRLQNRKERIMFHDSLSLKYEVCCPPIHACARVATWMLQTQSGITARLEEIYFCCPSQASLTNKFKVL